MAGFVSIFIAAGIIIIGISILFIKKRVPINNWFGLRWPIIMENKDLWYEANYRVGIFLFSIGITVCLLSLILFFIPSIDTTTYSISMSLILLISAIIFAIISYLISNSIANKKKG